MISILQAIDHLCNAHDHEYEDFAPLQDQGIADLRNLHNEEHDADSDADNLDHSVDDWSH